MSGQTRESGYTLIELLVVIGILAVVAAIATPVTGHVVRASEARSDTYRLVTLLRQLQNEAASRQEVIKVTASAAVLDISTGQKLTLSNAATIQMLAPLTYYPDGTTSGGNLMLHDGDLATHIKVAWLVGTIHIDGAP
jgi:general secretion pathway protein H